MRIAAGVWWALVQTPALGRMDEHSLQFNHTVRSSKHANYFPSLSRKARKKYKMGVCLPANMLQWKQDGAEYSARARVWRFLSLDASRNFESSCTKDALQHSAEPTACDTGCQNQPGSRVVLKKIHSFQNPQQVAGGTARVIYMLWCNLGG